MIKIKNNYVYIAVFGYGEVCFKKGKYYKESFQSTIPDKWSMFTYVLELEEFSWKEPTKTI